MVPVVMAIGAAVAAAAPIVGKALAGGDEEAAREAVRKALKEFNIPPSQVEEVVAQQIESAYSNLQTDPALKEAQKRALDSFLEMEQSGGLTLADQAAQNKVMNQVARRESAGRAAITNDMQARGTLGGGAELAMKLKNQQDAAGRANEVGMDTAAAAQRRYFDSVLARGNMAGNMRDQEFGEKSKIAEAQDRIAQYNADMRYRAQNQRNDNRARTFDQRFRTAGARADIRMGQAGQHRQDAQDTRQVAGKVGSAINQGISSYGSYANGGEGGGYGSEEDDELKKRGY